MHLIKCGFIFLPEVGNRDDDKEVEKNSEKRDTGQYDVKGHIHTVGVDGFLAGVVALWEAEFFSFHHLHPLRESGEGEL